MTNVKENTRIWREAHPAVKRRIFAAAENMTIVEGVATDANGRDITHLINVGPKLAPEKARGLEVVNDLTELERENGGFVFAFFKTASTIVERFPTLTPQDIARLMYIGTYTAWQTGRLQSDNGKAIIDRAKLEQLVEMSRKRFNELFKRYEEEGILREDTDTGEIFINQTVFYRGRIKDVGYDISDLHYTRMFRTTVRDLYAKFKGRTLGQLALIYSIMPFLNFETNIVCYNPEETDDKLIRPMSLDKLAALLGYANTSKLKRAMNAATVGEQKVFNFPENVKDRRERRVIVNPRVIYAGSGDDLKALSAQFN